MNIGEIIAESDVMVPNSFGVNYKISWLNELNQDFFNVVKIPMLITQTTTNSPTYTLGAGVLAKNIDLVQVGLLIYRSILEEDVRPGQNYWNFDDISKVMTLNPAPYVSGLMLKVRYHRTATTTFTTNNLNITPDAPIEFHWAYVLGLNSKIAKSMDDLGRANNYENDYRNYLNIAAANYSEAAT